MLFYLAPGVNKGIDKLLPHYLWQKVGESGTGSGEFRENIQEFLQQNK